MPFRFAAPVSAAFALAVGTVAALTVPAVAVPQPDLPGSGSPLAAMQRDLGLTLEQAQQRLAQEASANQLDQTLRPALAGAFGGSYFDAANGKLVVGATDPAKLDQITSSGADAKLVTYASSVLDESAKRLGARSAVAPQPVTGWYVSSRENSVILTTARGTANQASDFVRASGADPRTIKVVESDEVPQTYADVIGGNAYYVNNRTRCSIGFAVTDGFVSAGHCGNPGDSTTQPSGTFAASSFPGNDYSYVKVAAGETPRGQVNNYSGGTVAVGGSAEAAEGASVCRSGSTTGWHCGVIQAKNQTVRYQQGAVDGLTRTNVCAEPGDSGGSWLSGNQAQGVTSGGSGDCTSGGTTYFQPVNEILQAYKLTLLTQ